MKLGMIVMFGSHRAEIIEVGWDRIRIEYYHGYEGMIRRWVWNSEVRVLRVGTI